MGGNISRIILYIRLLITTDFKQRIKQYTIMCVIFVLAVSLLNITRKVETPLAIFLSEISGVLAYLFRVAYFILALVITSKSFNLFHRKNTAMYAFTFPVSSGEKYIATLIFTYVTNVVVVILGIFVAFVTIYVIFSDWSAINLYFQSFLNQTVILFKNLSFMFMFFFAGAVFFKHNQFFKTIIFGILFLIIIIALFFVIVYSKIKMQQDMFQNTFMLNLEQNNYLLQWLIFALGFIAIILGYFKFKKLQCV